MSEKVAIKKSTLEAIGEAVRGKECSTDLIPVNDLADRITALPTASGENKLAQLASKTITEVTEKDLEGATAIEKYMFYYCKKLQSIDIPSSVTRIGEHAFYYCGKLQSIDIPSSVTTVERYAFYWCESFTNITIPDSVKSVGDNVFDGCRNLQSAIVGNGVKGVPKYMFNGCTNLTSVTFLYDITNINQYAFFNCYALTNLTIPSSVTYIDIKALHLGTTENKATITFLRTTPPTITNQTFDANKLNKIIVPKGCGDAYKSATNWANFADYIEEAAE